MKPTRIFTTCAATAVCALGAVTVAASAATTDVSQASSENWSGYVIGTSSDRSESATKFRSVSGSWVAPTARCTAASSYSAFWVGLGGAGQTEALEQAGTEANCSSSGQASYYAWYELVPSAPVKVDLAVHPGDHITTKVAVAGSAVTISVSNATTGQTFTRNLTMSNSDTSSAEWIAEAPSACDSTVSDCTPLPLTNFGKVSFTSSSATTADGHTGSISDAEWSTDAVSLTPGAESSGLQGASLTAGEGSGSAAPSSLSYDGASFSVAYSADSSGSASPTGAGQGDPQGYGYGYGGGDGYGGAAGYGYGYGDNGYDGYGGGYSGGYTITIVS